MTGRAMERRLSLARATCHTRPETLIEGGDDRSGGRSDGRILPAFLVSQPRRGGWTRTDELRPAQVVRRTPCEVGRWSDAESPDQGGWVVGRNGYPKVRVHVGKRTQPWGVGGGPSK